MNKVLVVLFAGIMGFTALQIFSQNTVDTLKGSTLSREKHQDTVSLEKIVVTATRYETPIREIASSMSVITSEEIAQHNAKMVSDVLNDLPGVSVAQLGGLGKYTNAYIRGANAEHTLVLVDGIEMSDPMSMGHAFDFANLTTDNVERIEVIRGPQSTLYGSDAIGGVINILTRHGKGKPSFYALGEGGSFHTFREMVGVNGAWEWVDYSFDLSRLVNT